MGAKKKIYNLQSELWIYPGPSTWYFLNIDKEKSNEIKKAFGANARGFGSLRVEVTVGESKWNTSIFWSSREGVYALPVKAQIRKKEGLFEGDNVKYVIKLL